MPTTIDVQGLRVPALMYGTAWKEERTTELTLAALQAGFRAIDTANQRKHYFEAGVGRALAQSGLARDQLFIQTKFTYRRGQDDRLPYDPDAPIATQVLQSFTSSLEHLGLERLDSLVLHGPWAAQDWSAQDREAWGAMQALQRDQRVRLLGVSNISRAQLEALCARERVPPAFVQNRCYARTGWDADVRAFCRDHGIVYQGFSLLTANPAVLQGSTLGTIARRLRTTPAQVVFAFCHNLGMLPLTGTCDREHMEQDLASLGVTLQPVESAAIERLGH